MSETKAWGGSWRMIINLILLILGIVFIINPMQMAVGITLALGLVLIVYGGLMIALDEVREARHEAHGNVIWPIIWLICGIFLIIFARRAGAWLLPLIVGIWMIVHGIDNLRLARIIRQTGEKDGIIAMGLSIAEIVLGILTLCGITGSIAMVTILPGLCMLIFGACTIVSWWINRSALGIS